MRDGFFRVAAATPQVKVADVEVNAGRIVGLYLRGFVREPRPYKGG